MPGAYAHLTMATRLSTPSRLEGLGGLTRQQLAPLLMYTKFFELGAVSPDYPYLHPTAYSKAWAEVMHYTGVDLCLKAGLLRLRKYPLHERYKPLAWFLGFLSHVIADATVHPVVNLLVGPYEQNKTAHRVCEMHQDVFVYQVLGIGKIHTNAFLKDGIGTCGTPQDKNKLDTDITTIWKAMLQNADRKRFTSAPPRFNDWHKSFRALISAAAPGKLLAWSRHVGQNSGLIYPATPDNRYLLNLRVPGNATMNYADLLEKTERHILSFWDLALRATLTNETVDLAPLRNWNLDTGKDEEGKLTFWEV